MEINIPEEFVSISREILDAQKTEAQWAEVESDDMFQRESFVGGYDADERAFCFSYYDEARNEFWFQLPLDEIENVASGKRRTLQVRPVKQR